MVDDAEGQNRRVRTLSDSSRSDVSTPSVSEVSQLSTDRDQFKPSRSVRSRKQNIREIREEIEDDPELYGVRRSGRSRKEPFRFEPQFAPNPGRGRRLARHHSTSSSDEDHSSDDVSYNRWNKWKRRDRSVRTRGNRVSYKSAFLDASSDEYEGEADTHMGNHNTLTKANGQQTSFQKPKGPLVRRLSTSSRVNSRNTRVSGKSSDLDDQSATEEPLEDNQFNIDAEFGDEEEADVIEDILTHAVRRKGAVGNPTTLYNSKLEKDLNEGFDSNLEEGELQFLIKWRNWSHIHSTWETEASLLSPDRGSLVHGIKKLKLYEDTVREREEFLRSAELDELDTIAYEDERKEQILTDKMTVERIVSHSRDPENDSFDYFIKWLRLEYRFSSWESGKVIKSLYPSAVHDYDVRCRCSERFNRHCEALYNRPRIVPLTEQPSYLCDSDELKLRDYQLEGINWIARAWSRNNSAILADEMGLGKTIQTIGFLSYLFNEHKIYGPFLIVVPLSTASSWQKELQSWAPKMNTIIYTGDHLSRQLIREYEWCIGGAAGIKRQQSLKFHVCVTTYEILLKDKSWLCQVPWSFLGVDEAHRLKNDCSQLYKTLQQFDTNTRLLITGTPLQNTMRELWALLHFIMPEKFPNWDEFEELYNLNPDDPASKVSGEVFHNLHKVLRPFLLRRVKKDVESSLPEKIEQILRVNMTLEQANIYRLILARNYDGLLKVTRGHRTSFINIVMELKKCCNHAHLIAPPPEDEKFKLTRDMYLISLIKGSGKLTLLDKLLHRLKSGGHRVLIFSQMVRMLDLIADYLSLRGWGFQRLDGSIRGAIRKQALDHFNADGSTDFCFLLSTRAGGLGINLATADTVIIFDSDWNPQNDLQAQARAHRIGQTKQVSVYRLVTQESVEEKIIESATRKMVLDHLVIQRMESSNKAGTRKGDTAKGQLLSEILRYGAEGLFSRNDEDRPELEVDIDDILNRAETRDTEAATDANPANTLLSSFKVASFDPTEEEPLVSKDTKTWDEIIPSNLRDQLKAEEAQRTLIDLELGPRRRRQVKAFQAGLDIIPSDGSSEDESSYKPTTLSEKEIRSLVRAIKRFARPLERIEAIAADAELPHITEKELTEIVSSILDGCRSAMEAVNLVANEDTKSSGKGPTFHYGRVPIAVKPLLQSLEFLETLYQTLPSESKEARLSFELPFLPKLVAWSCPWDMSDDVRLLTGVYELGYDNWEAIKLDADLGLGSKLLPVSPSERPQAPHIRSRVDYLIRMLAKDALKGHDNVPITGTKRNHTFTETSATKPKNKQQPPVQIKSKSKKVANVERSSNHSKPKSAEFVETDDSSSDSDDTAEQVNINVVSVKRPKSDSSPVEKVKSRPKSRKSSSDDHFVHKPPRPETTIALAMSKEEENDFHSMRGPLFLKCKEKLLPIKKHFKHLERLEDSTEEDSKQFSKVILRIGDHIHNVVESTDDKNDRHQWKNYLWQFVQIFSRKSKEELRHIYRRAAKRRLKDRQNIDQSSHPHTESIERSHSPKHLEEDAHDRTRWDNSSQPGFYHRDKFKKDRDDARFDNAFNRPPSYYDHSQKYHNSSNRSFISSSRHHQGYSSFNKSSTDSNYIKHRAPTEPCDSNPNVRSAPQSSVIVTPPVNIAQSGPPAQSPNHSNSRDPRLTAVRR